MACGWGQLVLNWTHGIFDVTCIWVAPTHGRFQSEKINVTQKQSRCQWGLALLLKMANQCENCLVTDSPGGASARRRRRYLFVVFLSSSVWRPVILPR